MTQSEEAVQQHEQSDLYGEKWQAFAFRHHLALFLLYGWIPACLALFLLSQFWLHQPELMVCLMGVWLILAFASIWWVGEFRCPRCSRRYGALGGGRSISLTRGLFDKICPNCRLAKFETHPVVADPPDIP